MYRGELKKGNLRTLTKLGVAVAITRTCIRRTVDRPVTSRARWVTNRSGKSLQWVPVSRCATRAIASAFPGYNTLADAANGVRAASQYFVKKASAQECR